MTTALIQDASDAIYSAAISIGEAIQALDRKMYTWSTVKLYYATFYLARASLGLDKFALIYVKTTPYVWRATAGEVPKKTVGTTHKATLEAFTKYRTSSPLLSQLIVAEKPFDWLMALRESVNYKLPRFSEPNAPDHFKFVERNGVRQLLIAYIKDGGDQYTFDPEHAMLAFPIAALKETLKQRRIITGCEMCETDRAFILTQCFDKKGPISDMRRLLMS